jgi:hypothetical protein
MKPIAGCVCTPPGAGRRLCAPGLCDLRALWPPYSAAAVRCCCFCKHCCARGPGGRPRRGELIAQLGRTQGARHQTRTPTRGSRPHSHQIRRSGASHVPAQSTIDLDSSLKSARLQARLPAPRPSLRSGGRGQGLRHRAASAGVPRGAAPLPAAHAARCRSPPAHPVPAGGPTRSRRHTPCEVALPSNWRQPLLAVTAHAAQQQQPCTPAMAAASITSVSVVNNPAAFNDPIILDVRPCCALLLAAACRAIACCRPGAGRVRSRWWRRWCEAAQQPHPPAAGSALTPPAPTRPPSPRAGHI